ATRSMYVIIDSATAKPTTPFLTLLGGTLEVGRPGFGWDELALAGPCAIVLHHIRMDVLTGFQAMEANLRQSFRVLAQGRPHAAIAELDGVSIASLGAAFQMFNAAFLSREVSGPEDLEKRLRAARAVFDPRRIPWSFWICDEWLARPARRDLVDTCESFGMRIVAEMPGMVADPLRDTARFSLRSRPTLPLDIRRAEDGRTMSDFRAVGSLCFHVPPAWFGEVFDDTTPSREFRCWVGYHEGRPVATAATVVSHGVIGLYNVASIPGEQR